MRVLNILLENDFAEKVYLSSHINFLLQHLHGILRHTMNRD